LASARCRFGKYLAIKVKQTIQDGTAAGQTQHGLQGISQSMRAIMKDFPPKRELTDQGEFFKGLGIRFEIEKSSDQLAATAQLQLGESARFFPSDAALASWYAAVDSQAGAETIKLVY
jgi:DNA polymerase-3 subunit alpha